MSTQLKPLKALGISGSPSSNSRSRLLIGGTLAHLAKQGVETGLLDLLDLPAEALLARSQDVKVDEAIQQAIQADILVLGTPIYRASYSGQLKAFFDLFPQDALRSHVVGLIATGAGSAHTLSVDHGLRPLVASLRGLSAAHSLYVTDAQIPDKTQLSAEIDQQAAVLAQELYLLSYSLKASGK
jgi:FMN reductase